MRQSNSNGDVGLSSFDKDFGRQFEAVEETVVLGDLSAKLLERFPVNDPEILKEHYLYVCDPTGEEWLYPIRGEAMIGRAPDNHIVLNDRSVSRHHLALNTDGELYWYQDLNSGNGTQVNNEFVQEGWLVGGEEIVIGNSRLYFHLPEGQAPAEIADNPAEETNQEVNAQSQSDAPSTPSTTSTNWVFPILFVVLLISAGVVGWLLWKKIQTKSSPTPPVIATKDPAATGAVSSSEQQALDLYKQGKQFLNEKKWKEADLNLRRSASLLSDNNPLRGDILLYAKIADREVMAESHLNKAHRLYYEQDRTREALRHLSMIAPNASIYNKAVELRQRIYTKDIEPKWREAKLQIEANKLDDAKESLKRLLVFEPNHAEATELLKKLTSGEIQTAPPPTEIAKRPIKKNTRYIRRREQSGAAGNIGQGLSSYRNGDIANAIVIFRRLESQTSNRNQRRQAQIYRTAAQTYQNNWNQGQRSARNGQFNQAISALSRALTADRQLGGTNRSQISVLLARMHYERGQRTLNSGNYAAAANDFKRAQALDSRNTKAYQGLQSLRKKAKDLLEEGEVLIGISNTEARKKFQDAQRFLSSSDPLYRKAAQLLNKTQ
jgi:outer membrane protein assembly factor BamD (BamD/ComL family)